MVNIIIPCAGSAKRFFDAGYTEYKPLLPIGGVTMIEKVMDNLIPNEEHRFILVHRKEHRKEFHKLLLQTDRNIELVEIDEVTSGAAETIMIGLMEAKVNEGGIIVANCDQYVRWFDVNTFIKKCRIYGSAGIVEFGGERDPKYSYVEINEMNNITRVAEKNPISDYATVGIYYYQDPTLAKQCIARMMDAGDTHNGEYYFCPSFNYVPRHKIIVPYGVWKADVLNLGTPEEYEKNKDKVK